MLTNAESHETSTLEVGRGGELVRGKIPMMRIHFPLQSKKQDWFYQELYTK
jgi:hypothetical protein